MTFPFRVHVVAIGEYDQSVPNPQINLAPAIYADADNIAHLLTERLGGHLARPVLRPGLDADREWMIQRLEEWVASADDDSGSSVLVWMGHGNSTSKSDAWLSSARASGVDRHRSLTSSTLADAVQDEWSNRQRDSQSWTVIIVQACSAADIRDNLIGELAKLGIPDRTAVVYAGGQGQTTLEVVRSALERTIDSYGPNDVEIHVRDFVGRLGSYLPDGGEDTFSFGLARPIPRERLYLDGITATQDVVDELTQLMAQLDVDQRSHFIPKARGGEQAELAWYFEGRGDERREIATWLRESTDGMFVVTGEPGSGKSALLGKIVAQANPRLRDLLQRAGLVEPETPDLLPPDDVFDAVIVLTGMSASDVLARLAVLCGLDPDTSGSISARIELLTRALWERERPFTAVFDALDESEDPLVIASAVIRRIAAIKGCRVVIGTRSSTNLTLDLPAPLDSNLLDALGLEAAGYPRLHVSADPHAVGAYVRKRLSIARLSGLSRDVVDALAAGLADRRVSFLFARLAVHEFIADPALLASPDVVLDGSHSDLFLRAVRRLGQKNRAFEPLLRALSLAEGRGMPRADRIWATAAEALAPVGVREADIDDLLLAAAPYIMLDAERGHSVYRLAHRSFQETLNSREAPAEAGVTRRSVSHALLDLATTLADSDPEAPLHPFLRFHLPAYVADGGLWHELASRSSVLDRVDFRALSSQAYRSLFGTGQVPREIASAVAEHDETNEDSAQTRAWLRLIGRSRWSDFESYAVADAPDSKFQPEWALREKPELLSVLLARDCVSMAAVRIGLRPAVATAHRSGAITLWDLSTGLPSHSLAERSAVPFASMRSVDGEFGSILAAVDIRGGISFWDVERGEPIGYRRVIYTSGDVTLSVVHPMGGQPTVITHHPVGGVYCWDPAAGAMVGVPFDGGPLPYEISPVTTLEFDAEGDAVLVEIESTDSRSDPPFVAHTIVDQVGAVISLFQRLPDKRFTGWDDTLTIWNHSSGSLIRRLYGATQGARVFPYGDRLVVACPDVIFGFHDAHSGEPIYELERAEADVTALSVASLDDGSTIAVIGYEDGDVRVIRQFADRLVEWSGSAEAGAVREISIVDGSNGPAVVTLGETDAPSVWDAESGLRLARFGLAGMRSPRSDRIRILQQDSTAPPRITAASALSLTIWDASSGEALVRHPMPHLDYLDVVELDDGRLVAFGHGQQVARLWDPLSTLPAYRLVSQSYDETRSLIPAIDVGREGHIPAAVLFGSAGRALISTQSGGYLEIWDPVVFARLGRLPLARADQGDQAIVKVGPRTCVAQIDGDAIVLWDAYSDTEQIAKLEARGQQLKSLHVIRADEQSDWIAAVYQDSLIRLWNPLREDIHEWPVPSNVGVRTFACFGDADNRVILSTRSKGVDAWWPTTTHSSSFPLPFKVPPASALAPIHHNDGRSSVAALDPEGICRLFDLDTGRERPLRIPQKAGGSCRAILSGTTMGRPILVTHEPQPRFWSLSDQELVSEQPTLAYNDSATRSSFSVGWPDGRSVIALVDERSVVRLFDLSGRPVGTRLGRNERSIDTIMGILDTAGRHLLVIYRPSGSLELWDPEIGKVGEVVVHAVREIRVSESTIYCRTDDATFAFRVVL